MSWWQGIPMRLLQTNLREIDVPLDPQAYARTVAELGANVALFNLGGIVANYPTRLPFHFHNPRLTEDLIPELIRELHRLDIRFIGRFDFSKVNQVIGADHPDWLYHDLHGETVTYNGQLQCCVNGAYQQECSLAILDEALEMYPLDGIFFNMIGYQTRDYSGVYHGLCQCDNCRRCFLADTGESLPVREEEIGGRSIQSDPVYRRYLRFCDETSRELFRRIRDTIKAKNRDCAISTYISEGIDILRSESNSGIRRPQPEFIYDASLNVRRVRASWPGLAASNAAVHFIDFPYRHAAVSPELTARRLAQNFIHGGWLDYYVIGRLEEQQDRACQPAVKRLFHLHQQAQGWLAESARPLADVCLIEGGPANPDRDPEELRGWITLLSEAHVLYDVLQEAALGGDAARGAAVERLARYPLVILPDLPSLPTGLASALDAYVRGGGRLLLTGRACLAHDASLEDQPLQPPPIECTGISAIREAPFIPGAYLAMTETDRLLFPGLDAVDWIPLDVPWLECTPADGSRALLRYVPVGMFGPPEKCYYTEITDKPGIVVHPAGQGVCVTLPWQIGSQYSRFPTHAIGGLVLGILDGVLGLKRSLLLDAPPQVELSAFAQDEANGLLLGLANLSGQNGRATHAPLPVFDLRFTLPSRPGKYRVETLTQGEIPSTGLPDGSLSFTLPRLDLLEMVRVSRIYLTE